MFIKWNIVFTSCGRNRYCLIILFYMIFQPYDNVQHKIVVEYQEDCLIYSDLGMIYINLHTKLPLNGIGIVWLFHMGSPTAFFVPRKYNNFRFYHSFLIKDFFWMFLMSMCIILKNWVITNYSRWWYVLKHNDCISYFILQTTKVKYVWI